MGVCGERLLALVTEARGARCMLLSVMASSHLRMHASGWVERAFEWMIRQRMGRTCMMAGSP